VVPAQVLQRQIDEDFQLPGLISIPTRVSVPKGKGYAFLTARYKAVSDEEVITIPPDVVRETVAELERPRPDDSARDQLFKFVVLYKYILDTTVKRTVAERQKKLVDHTYMQLRRRRPWASPSSSCTGQRWRWPPSPSLVTRATPASTQRSVSFS